MRRTIANRKTDLQRRSPSSSWTLFRLNGTWRTCHSPEGPLIDMSEYTGLFMSALIAATVLPAQSEALLVFLLLDGDYSVAGLLVSASVGNVLGSVLNYLLGRLAETYSRRRWFPVKPATLDRAKNWYHRYGRWSLLLSWAPLIGDPITVAAGVLREPFWSFLLLVTLAKVGRYLALAAVTLNWM